MNEPTTSWLVDSTGTKALVTNTAKDPWLLRGWAETSEPDDGDWVWLEHEEHRGKQRFTAAAVELWAARGWYPSAPPEPVDPTKDPQLGDVQGQPEAPAAPAPEPKTKTTGAAGKTEEK